MANYYYDLPNEIRHRILFMCIAQELREKLESRKIWGVRRPQFIESISDFVKRGYIPATGVDIDHVMTICENYGFRDMNHETIPNIINTIKDGDLKVYWEILLIWNINYRVYKNTISYLKYKNESQLVELCNQNRILTPYKYDQHLYSRNELIRMLLTV
jgi:hypothetical protein